MAPLEQAPQYAAAPGLCEGMREEKPLTDKLKQGIDFFLKGMPMPDACR